MLFFQFELILILSNCSHGLVGHRQRDSINDFKSPAVFAYYNVDYVKNVKGDYTFCYLLCCLGTSIKVSYLSPLKSCQAQTTGGTGF